jgi:hypothetical protein
MNQKYEINKELVVSTAHLKQETAKAMDDVDSAISWTRDNVEYGYLVYVPNEGYADEDEDFPEEMRAVVKLARSLGCKWIRYDCDGPELDGFAKFDW